MITETTLNEDGSLMTAAEQEVYRLEVAFKKAKAEQDTAFNKSKAEINAEIATIKSEISERLSNLEGRLGKMETQLAELLEDKRNRPQFG